MTDKRFNNDDSELGVFLDSLEQDAEQLQPLDATLAYKLKRLVDGIEVDLDAPLPDEAEWREKMEMSISSQYRKDAVCTAIFQ